MIPNAQIIDESDALSDSRPRNRSGRVSDLVLGAPLELRPDVDRRSVHSQQHHQQNDDGRSCDVSEVVLWL